MKRLSTLFKERGEAYANADVRVSLESMNSMRTVCSIFPSSMFIYFCFFLPSIVLLYKYILLKSACCDDVCFL